MSKGINSPFRYAGGKFYARKLILNHIPPHTSYVEPFAGSGSIFFAKKKVEFNHLNDLDEELVNVYNTIKDNPEGLIDFLTKQPFHDDSLPEGKVINVANGSPLPALKELHTFFKKVYTPTTLLEQAGRWYYLNRTSYSGIMNYQNMYWGYGDKFSMQPRNWPANIRRASEKLQNVEITSLDFEEVIDNAPDGNLLFIDPPYFNTDQDKFYTHSFNHNDHQRLLECVERNNERLFIFITYDNTPEIREMYSWMTEMHDQEWNYSIQRTDNQKNNLDIKGSRYKGKELFILNYKRENLELVKQGVQLRLEV
ncbi:MAG: DNA adenine methylase [Bacteroidota bacterium]